MPNKSLFCQALGVLAACCLMTLAGCGSTMKTTASNGTCYIGKRADPAVTHGFECEESGGTWVRDPK